MSSIKIVSKAMVSSILACTWTTSCALADVSLSYSSTKGKTKFHITDGKLRIDMMSGDKRNGGLYYNIKTDELLMALDAKKQVMNLEEMASIVTEQKGQVQEMLKEQMEVMNDDQKEKFKNVMDELSSDLLDEEEEPKELPKTQFKYTGDNRTVGDYTCELVELTLDDGDQSTVCVAKAKSLGIDSADEAVLHGMMKKMSMIAEKMGSIAENNTFGFAGSFKDVLVKSYAEDQSELTAITPLLVDGEDMTVPADYELTNALF